MHFERCNANFLLYVQTTSTKRAFSRILYYKSFIHFHFTFKKLLVTETTLKQFSRKSALQLKLQFNLNVETTDAKRE